MNEMEKLWNLNYVYKKARCFVFPSLYEGFGLPLLESMNMDCPVVCSDTSCFPEVTNSSAVMFNPNDIENIIYEINTTIESKLSKGKEIKFWDGKTSERIFKELYE